MQPRGYQTHRPWIQGQGKASFARRHPSNHSKHLSMTKMFFQRLPVGTEATWQMAPICALQEISPCRRRALRIAASQLHGYADTVFDQKSLPQDCHGSNANQTNAADIQIHTRRHIHIDTMTSQMIFIHVGAKPHVRLCPNNTPIQYHILVTRG